MWSKFVPVWSAQGDWYPVTLTAINTGGVILAAAYQGTTNYCWKFSSSGNLVWSKGYSGSGSTGLSITERSNGDLLIMSALGSQNTVAGSVDICIIETDNSGNVQWCKSYGGTYVDWIRTVSNTSDGGFLLCGETNSVGSGEYDSYLIKADASGSVEWAKTYGTVWTEIAADARQSTDEGFILTGLTYSIGYNSDSIKIHVVKTNSSGETSCFYNLWNPTLLTQTISITPPPDPQAITLLIGDDFQWIVNNIHFYQAEMCDFTPVESIVSFGSGLQFFPNPVQNLLTINLDPITKEVSIRIFDLQGREMNLPTSNFKSPSSNSIQLNTENLLPGFYTLQIINNKIGKSEAGKFVKEY